MKTFQVKNVSFAGAGMVTLSKGGVTTDVPQAATAAMLADGWLPVLEGPTGNADDIMKNPEIVAALNKGAISAVEAFKLRAMTANVVGTYLPPQHVTANQSFTAILKPFKGEAFEVRKAKSETQPIFVGRAKWENEGESGTVKFLIPQKGNPQDWEPGKIVELWAAKTDQGLICSAEKPRN